MLSKKVLLLSFLFCAVIAIKARYWSDDMDFAASGKDEKWEKGGGKDHHEEEHSSHGDKGTVKYCDKKIRILTKNYIKRRERI
jgi:hypothetical protein